MYQEKFCERGKSVIKTNQGIQKAVFVKYETKLKRKSPEAVVRRCSIEIVVLKNSQNSQENICSRASFLIKLQGAGLQLY